MPLTPTDEAAWQAFAHTAHERLADGRRRLIPIVGSGFNVQATGNVDSWLNLLTEIAKGTGLPPTLPLDGSALSMTAVWERLVAEIAFHEQSQASEAEQSLRAVVQKTLMDFEEASHGLPFFDTFLALGFRDLLSLNFDRTLSLRQPGSKNVVRHGTSQRFTGIKRAPLTRHATMADGTRIWYPHGDTQARGTIKLGIRDYGVYIGALEEAFGYFKRDERTFLEHHGHPEWSAALQRSWGEAVRAQPPGTLTWLALALTAPLLLLGCGMTSDEWPLWWLLHQRVRNLAQQPLAERDPVFLLWNVASAAHDESQKSMTRWLRSAPAGIRLLACDGWREGWERLFDTFNNTP